MFKLNDILDYLILVNCCNWNVNFYYNKKNFTIHLINLYIIYFFKVSSKNFTKLTSLLELHLNILACVH